MVKNEVSYCDQSEVEPVMRHLSCSEFPLCLSVHCTGHFFVVRDKVGRPPGELEVSKSMECEISLQCFDTVGWVTGRAFGL